MIGILIAIGIPVIAVLICWGTSAGIRRNVKNEMKVDDFIWDIIRKVNFDWDRETVSDIRVDACNEVEETERKNEIENLNEVDRLIKEAKEWKIN